MSYEWESVRWETFQVLFMFFFVIRPLGQSGRRRGTITGQRKRGRVPVVLKKNAGTTALGAACCWRNALRKCFYGGPWLLLCSSKRVAIPCFKPIASPIASQSPFLVPAAGIQQSHPHREALSTENAIGSHFATPPNVSPLLSCHCSPSLFYWGCRADAVLPGDLVCDDANCLSISGWQGEGHRGRSGE